MHMGFSNMLIRPQVLKKMLLMVATVTSSQKSKQYKTSS